MFRTDLGKGSRRRGPNADSAVGPRSFETKPHRAAALLRAIAAVPIVVVFAVAGCATGRQVVGPEPEPLTWPPPPLSARVTFVRLLSDQDSLRSPKRNFAQSVVDFFSGRQPPLNHLYQPMGIEVSDDGQRVYIADFGQMLVYLADLTTGSFAPLSRNFERPFGVALDDAGNLYVSEQDARRITVLDPSQQSIRVITDSSLIRPAGIAIDRSRGLLYVADASKQNSTDHSVKVFDLSGRLLRTVGAGRGDCAGCLLFPTFVTVDKSGRVFVANTLNGRVEVFDADGTYLRRLGERGNAFGMFDKPKGVALDTYGNVFVVDSGWSNVQIFNESGEVLLFFGGRGTAPGLLSNPTGIAIDGQNRIYVADFLNSRVAVYDLLDAKPAEERQREATDSAAGRSR
jgi:DNA-binding beta-propeller fold protein YncE